MGPISPLSNWAAKAEMWPASHTDPSGDPVAKQDQSVALCFHSKSTWVTAVTPLNGAALSPANNLSDELQPAFVE